MKTTFKSFGVAVTAILALSSAACGGGGGDDGGTVGGIDRTGTPVTVAYGPVTAFGSVWVNGVRFDTTSASFTIDGQTGSQNDLHVGDIVAVRGQLASGSTTQGTATSVSFKSAVEGPIASLTVAANGQTGSLVVLGQTVQITADTSFDNSLVPASIAGLRVGLAIEVSGLRTSNGAIAATRIEPKAAGGELELHGTVAALNDVTKTFSLNALVVSYATAQLQNFPVGSIANGNLVEVKGTTVDAQGRLVATRVELEGREFQADAGQRLELEGFVTRFVNATDFDVAGIRVTTNAQTAFTGGTAANIALDTKLQVKGTVDASGVLVASSVEIRRAKSVRIAARVDSVNATAGSFVTLGITVAVDSQTRVEDKSSQQLRPFTLANLAAGDYVEVRGSEQPSDTVLATILERENGENDVELQGHVEAAAQPTLQILGVTITANGSTSFENLAGTSVSAASFFASLVAETATTSGTLVKVTGTEVADRAIVAEELELEAN